VLHGVSKTDFKDHYWPVCRGIEGDNSIGKFLFGFTELIQKRRFARRTIYRMVEGEQKMSGHRRRMSMVLWDLFTGSATYRDILKRTLRPAFLARLLWGLGGALVTPSRSPGTNVETVGELDK
jgi:hypothetical protein